MVIFVMSVALTLLTIYCRMAMTLHSATLNLFPESHIDMMTFSLTNSRIIEIAELYKLYCYGK